MTRNKFWLISFGFIGLVLLSVPMLFAQMTYHIGSGRTADGVQYFDTLEDMRLVTDNDGITDDLLDGDTVILYADDHSLTVELGIAERANVTIRSDDPTTRRIIEMASGATGPIFNMNYPYDTGSTLRINSIELTRGYSPQGGGAVYAWWHNNLYLNNTIFSNNRGAALGGAIYYWDALDSEIVDSDFINNSTTGAGGAILINASTTLSQSDTTNVTLRVTENATVKLDAATGTYRPTSTFSGNRAGVTWDGQGSVVAGSGYANSIDFTGAEGNTVNFFIDTAEGTLLDMQDPFRTNVASSGYYDLGYTVNLDKTGLGTWRLGGASVIDGSSGTTVRILEGVLEFSRDAEINAIGANDSFTVSAGAEVLFNGNNRITGTTVTFSEGATMSFNLDNYQVGQTDAMLFLQGDDLTVSGTRINVNGLAVGQYGNFVLVEGANTLDIGDFNLWIGDANIDVSGRVSERYGYSLGYLEDLAGNVLNDKQLVLTVNPTDNTVLRWNDNGINEWNVTSKNWTLIRDNSMDSFVPGDTVQFFGSGTHRVNLTEDVLIKHNSVRDAEGKTWYAAANDTTGMHVSGDGNWTFTGKSIVDSTTLGRASLLFDGSGTLTLAGEKANDYSYTVLAGTGTLLTANANQLGTQAVYFRDSEYKTPEEVSKLHFTAGTTLETQLVAEKDGHGLVTASNAYGNNLTLSRVANENETRGGSVLVKDGGKLELSASPQGNFGRMIFSGNGTRRDAMTGSVLLTEGGAVYVENGGELTLNKTEFLNNVSASKGGAISSAGKLNIIENTFSGNRVGTTLDGERGTATARGGALYLFGDHETTITDTDFTNNYSGGLGGAIHYEAGRNSSLTIASSADNTLLIAGNRTSAIFDPVTETWSGTAQGISIAGSGTANIVIDAAKNGVVDMQDALFGASGSYTLNVTKTGEGNWKLAGENNLQSRNTQFVIEAGRVQLAEAASIVTGGTVTIGTAGALDSAGGNTIEAGRVVIENQATLGFDLTHSDVLDDALLTVTAGNISLGNLTQQIDILELSSVSADGYGIYNLAELSTGNFDTSNMMLLYHGEDMTKFREHVGSLQTAQTANGTMLQVNIDISKMDNGVTVWTDAAETGVWNGTDMNWQGQGNIAGTEQFLHGDAVVFTDAGAGRIAVNAGGVTISNQGNVPGMTVNSSKDYTFHGGSITGNAQFLKQGSGTLTFEQANDFSTVQIANGNIVAKKVASLGSADVNIERAGSALIFDVVDSGEFAGDITGLGRLEKAGSGSLRLTGENDFAGGTTILGGELIGESALSFGTGNKIVTGIDDKAGVVTFDINDGDALQIITQTITGTGGLKNTGDKALVFDKANTYTGGTLNDTGATIIAQNVKSLGTGDIVNNGTLVFDLTTESDGALSQNISGTGGLMKTGDGTLSLDGTNSFSGDTILWGGELRVQNDKALQGSLVRLYGGDLVFGSLTQITLGGLASMDSASLSTLPEITLASRKGKAIAVTLQVDAPTEPALAEAIIYHGTLTGAGGIIKTGLGTQIFTGENSYTGGTLIDAGRLTVTHVQGLGTGDVENNAELKFDLAAAGTFGQNISGTGFVTKSGEEKLTLTGKNTYSGGTSIEQGTLEAHSFDAVGTGNVSLQDVNAVFVLNLEDAETMNREISGVGTFVKDGSGTLYSNGHLHLSGETHIQEGALFLNGTSNSDTTVFAGGVLGGNGVLDAKVMFKNGSAHIIGHRATGTLSKFTAQEIAYEGGSKIYVKVGQNGADQIVAKDKINFAQGGGTVDVVLVNLGLEDFGENEVLTKNYEVFVSEDNRLLLDGAAITNQTSDQDILTVDDVDAALRFVGSQEEGIGVLGYEVKTNADNSKSIVLNLSTFDAGTSAYLNGNQKALLRGLGNAEIFDRIYGFEKQERAQIADEMAPMIQTATPFMTQRAVTQFNLATFERLRFLREPMALAGNDQADATVRGQRLSHLHGPKNYIWFQNFGDVLRMSAASGTPEFQADAYGFSVGFDKGLGPHASVGLGMGGYFSDVNANAVRQSGEMNSYLISTYGNWEGNDGWLVAGSAGLVFSTYDLERQPGPFATKLSSQHDGTTIFASIEGNKKFRFGRFEMAPYAGLDFIWLCEEDYREKADGRHSALALQVDEQETFTVLSTVGVRLGRAFRLLGGNTIQPSVHAAWVHDWTESDITSSAAFTGMGTFKTRGASMHRDRAQLGANLNMTLNPRTDFFAKFNAELAKRYSDLSFHFGFRLGF